MTENHYQVLGVTSTATTAQIKSAYRNLALVVHPDQGGPATLFQRVSLAHEVLADPTRRQAYDLFLSEGGEDPNEFRRRERHWCARARQHTGTPPTPGATTTQQPVPAPGATPRRPADQQATPRHEHPQPAAPPPASVRQARYIRLLLRGAALSTIGFWVLQILWLVIDDDLDDISDVLDLSRSTWWILALAAANLAIALGIRAQHHRRHATANLAVTTIVCSTALLLIFLMHAARSDDLGIWAAAVGAAICGVSATQLRRTSTPATDSAPDNR